jgi:hypothetical protein
MSKDSTEFFFRTAVDKIAYVTKTFEAMGHLAIITTADKGEGRLRVVCDLPAAGQVKKILETLGCAVLPEK